VSGPSPTPVCGAGGIVAEVVEVLVVDGVETAGGMERPGAEVVGEVDDGGVGALLGVGLAVDLGTGVAVVPGVGLGVVPGVGRAVGVEVGVGVECGVGVHLGVGLDVGLGAGVGVRVGVGGGATLHAGQGLQGCRLAWVTWGTHPRDGVAVPPLTCASTVPGASARVRAVLAVPMRIPSRVDIESLPVCMRAPPARSPTAAVGRATFRRP
jgi:hypothetical protein